MNIKLGLAKTENGDVILSLEKNVLSKTTLKLVFTLALADIVLWIIAACLQVFCTYYQRCKFYYFFIHILQI